MKRVDCASRDICIRYKKGLCTVIANIQINIESCNKRELTEAGKVAVRNGQRK